MNRVIFGEDHRPVRGHQAANIGIASLVIDNIRASWDRKRLESEMAPPLKRQAIDEGSEMLNDGSSGKSTPGGTGADVQQVIIHNPQSVNIGNLKFKKTFQIYTAGYQFEKGEVFPTTNIGFQNSPFVSGAVALYTPLACLNPDQLDWYLTRAQWNNLPNFSYATSCNIKVTPLGYRLPFATNEAASTYANSQTLVQIGYTTGLNTMWNMIKAGYSTSDADRTTPTGFTRPINLRNTLYGSDGSIGCSIGVPRHYNAYTVLVVNDNQDIPLMEQICIQNVNDTKGMPIINYAHEFKNGLLKVPAITDRTDTWLQRKIMGQSAQGQGTNPGIPKAQGETNVGMDFDRTVVTQSRTEFTRNSTEQIEGSLSTITANCLIEKAPYLNNQLGQSQQPDRPPLVHFGCLPVQSNAALAPQATFSDVVVQWMVETELNVHYNMNYASSGSIPRQYIKAMDPEVWSQTIIDNLTNDSAFISNRFPEFRSTST